MVYLLSLTLKTFNKHEALCRIGEAPTSVFYLFEGQIGVTNLNNQVFNTEILKDKIFHTEAKGATLGDASILFNSNR